MDTREYLDLFLQDCKQRGLTKATMHTYQSRLTHFADELPELPTGPQKINSWLKARGETPKKRGKLFDALQSFYTFLERQGYIGTSPVPPRGHVGRPKKELSFAPPLHGGLNGLMEKAARGEGASSVDIPTAAAISAFFASRVGIISPNTRYSYANVLNRFARANPMLPLTPEPIETFLGSIKGSQDSLWLYWNNLKIFYKFLDIRYKLFSADRPNPFLVIIHRHQTRKIRRTLDFEQWQKLLSLKLPLEERALFELISDTGLRAGEIVNLTRERVHPGFITVIGKTGEHSVPISKRTHNLLQQIAKGPGPVFRTSTGVPYDRHTIYRRVSKRLKEIGYTGPKKGSHMLRHTVGRHYMLEGGDLESLRQLFGHQKIETTDRYAQLAFSDVSRRHREVGLLQKLLNNGGKGKNVSKKEKG